MVNGSESRIRKRLRQQVAHMAELADALDSGFCLYRFHIPSLRFTPLHRNHGVIDQILIFMLSVHTSRGPRKTGNSSTKTSTAAAIEFLVVSLAIDFEEFAVARK
jgi:hypothetical protein